MERVSLTLSQQRAIEMCLNGTDNILLYGNPGTGKTWLLQKLLEECDRLGLKALVTASTGIAASNIEGGRTLHGALRWCPLGTVYNYPRCAEILKDIDILIIDEVSMLGWDIIDHLAACLKTLKRPPKIIMSGDFFQLPPVYSRYPFENRNWASFALKPCILTEIVRQSDPEFVRELSRARLANPDCLAYFNYKTCREMIEKAIHLCTRNDEADAINIDRMNALDGKMIRYDARGSVKEADFRSTNVHPYFFAKEGMRVIALRNDPGCQYHNGTLGTIQHLADDSIRVLFDNGELAEVKRAEYSLDNINGCKDPVKIEQFPLGGGYAITIHKSQGQTFDAVNIHAPYCWASGQLYVALSRAKSAQGMYLADKISPCSLKADPRVIRFDRFIRGNSAA